MNKREIYKTWKSEDRSNQRSTELAQHKAIQNNNISTTAIVAGIPSVIASGVVNPYVTSQIAKTLAPIAAYEILNNEASKTGHPSVEHKIVNDIVGDNINDNIKESIVTTMAFIPTFISPSKIVTKLTPKQQSFWAGLTRGWMQYGDAWADERFAKHVANRSAKTRVTRYAPDIDQIIDDKAIRNDLKPGRHPYRLQQEGDKWFAYIQPEHRSDATYAGARAAAESALVKGTGSWDDNSVFIPKELMTLFEKGKQESPLKAMSSIMASKVTSGVKSQYNQITDPEIYKVVREGWNRGIWNSAGGRWTFDEFYAKNKPAIKKLLYRVPVVTGAGVLATQNEKGDQ